MTLIVELPFPPKELNPNKRLHWAKKARIVKDYRWQCGILTRAVTQNRPVSDIRPLPITIVFHAPDKRHRDKDNMIAAFKAGADGVADTIGVDDADWKPTHLVGEPVKNGKVLVIFELAD